MPLSDPVYGFAGLIEIDLPLNTVRLCDGGFLVWPSVGVFVSEDILFGTIDSLNSLTENIGDEAPSWKLILSPPSASLASALYQPDAQGSPVFFWQAEVNMSTGAIVGTPDLMASGFVDTLTLRYSSKVRKVEIGVVSHGDRFFWTKEGNVLSSRFHKAVFPGELGLDYATGTQVSVPWGVAGPPRGSLSLGDGSVGGVGPGSGRFGGPGGLLGSVFGNLGFQ
jgi:hypothetical protein